MSAGGRWRESLMGGGCFGLPRCNRNALGFVKKAGWRNKQELQTSFVLRPQGWIERQHRNKIYIFYIFKMSWPRFVFVSKSNIVVSKNLPKMSNV